MPTPVVALEKIIHDTLQQVVGRLAVKEKLEKDLAKVTQAQVLAERALREIEEAALIISAVEAEQQKELREKVEKLVSYGLSTIFEKDYKFILKQELRGNQTETIFCVTSSDTGDEPIPLRDAHGGGLVVVCSFLLQFIILMSSKPQLRPIFFKDEPFVAVSEEYREKLVEFIKKLAESANVQFVFVTHEQELADIGDKAYRFKISGGLTQVEMVK